MKLPSYSSCKPSGVEWLGDVPEHWEVKRLGWHINLFTGFAFQSEKFSLDEGIRLVRGDNITEGELRWGDRTRFWMEMTASLEKFLLEAGDIVIGMDGSKVGKNFAMVRDSELPLLLVQRVARVRCDEAIYRQFLLALIGSEQFRTWVELTKTEPAIPHISPHDIRAFPVPHPPLEEQHAIAAFLDRETGRVDRLVAKKRELIERLKEKRTALISRTVTRGLPPAAARAAGLPANPPLKPSGLDWLGDIPKHWEVRKFSRCAFFQEGPGLRNWQFTQDGVRVICVTNITEAGISFSNYEKFISEDEYQSTYRHFTVAKGDLLLSSSGNSWGKVATFDADDVAILNTSTIRVNQNGSRTVIRPLIGWLLTSEGTREQLGLFMTGSCQPNFGPSHLARVWICVPPLPEQAAIAVYLDEETAKLDALAGKVEEAVERLQEYRTALITAAVTGKIDVSTQSHV